MFWLKLNDEYFYSFQKGRVDRGQGEGFSDYLNIDIEIYIEIFNAVCDEVLRCVLRCCVV